MKIFGLVNCWNRPWGPTFRGVVVDFPPQKRTILVYNEDDYLTPLFLQLPYLRFVLGFTCFGEPKAPTAKPLVGRSERSVSGVSESRQPL